MKLRAIAMFGLCAWALSSAPVIAQTSFKVGETEVQAHGSIQQGFVWSDHNNFLTMPTTTGSGEMTDGSFNLSSQLTKKLRVGAQVYGRNIGQLGNGQVQFDWAFADFRVNDAIGVRGGKVKTALGLFNDTQDMEFLYTWAMLPQGVYPLDLRSVTIAHVGADIYGTIKLGGAGRLAYTAYAGKVGDDTRGGYRYGVEDSGYTFTAPIESDVYGGDARWQAPIEGLTIGYSFNSSKSDLALQVPAYGNLPVQVDLPVWRRQAFFGDFQTNGLRLSAEYRAEYQETTTSMSPDVTERPSAGWFAAASYRINDKLEVGTYHTRFVPDTNLPKAPKDNHIYDTAISARFDITSFWHVKAEGHFTDGTGNTLYARGFYARNNPTGMTSSTNMFVLRTGVVF